MMLANSRIFSILAILIGSIIPASRSAAQTAPPSNGLELWVRADTGVTANAEGLVESWSDQSGKNNNATQPDDTLKPRLVQDAAAGKPAIRFDGVDDYLDVVSAAGLDITGDIASFAVIRVDDYANFNSIWGKTSQNQPAPNDWYLTQNGGFPQFYRGDGSSPAQVQGQRAIRTNIYTVIGIRQEGTSVTHYLNGATNGTGQLTITPADAGTNLKIGSRDDLFTKMKGDIAELLIYSEALSDAQVTTAIEYLRNKYGITNTPPQIAITAPTNNATIPAPSTITVTVNATDPDGAVGSVTLFANGSPLATASAPPYTFPVTVETAGTVVFAASATDDRDATSSTNISVTLTSTTFPNLEANTHLKLWLRGDAGVTTSGSGAVTGWADQSGNNNNAAQGEETFAPTVGTLNGKPAIHFDGEDDYLDVADSDSISITGDIATFFVGRFEDFAGFRAVWGKTSSNQPRPSDYYLAQTTGIPNFVRGAATDEGQNLAQGVGGAGRVAANVPVLLGVQQSGSNVTHYLSGNPFGTGVITLVAQDIDTPLKVGSRDDLGTRMKGEIAELLIYDAALSSNELANVQQYLATKYNIPVLRLSNAAPAVQVTGPAAGSNVTAPGPFNITATATDAGGSVSRVDFYANGLFVGSDTTSPYSASFSTAFSGPVVLTAIATDNLGNRGTSSEVTVNVTGGQTAPIPVAGLALWLRADQGVMTNASGTITSWQDSSGNNNHAVQTDEAKAPALITDGLNGLPVLGFDGVDDSLEVASSPTVATTGDISTFFVVNIDDYDTYRAIWAKTAANLPAANDYYLLPGTGEPRYYHGNGTGGGIAQVTGAAAVPSGMFVTAGYELAAGVATHYLEGAENGSGALAAAGADLGTPLLVGTRADGVTRLKGSLAEIVIYGRALTEAERAAVQSYFRTKYFEEPSDQPSLTVTRGSNNTLVFAWPTTADGFALEASNVLGTGAAWAAVTEPVVVANNQNTVTVAVSGNARFFRLKK